MMIEIKKDSESIVVSPFQEEFVLDNFFVGANRVEVLSQIKEAMQNGTALMVITGEEGSGKTMLCRVLEHEVSPLCETLFFPRAVDSFEDVLQLMLKGLGLDAASENIDQTLDQIISFLLNESIDLLVIFDEAENIFLATLERIRKMLDRINESGARMYIIFSGRETFLENCDQLSICDFQNGDERHFSLSALSETETADYLANCAARLTDIDAAKIFTDEIVNNIYSLAKGNFRTTNILAAESVKIHGDDTSFMVLLDSVKEDNAGGRKNLHREILPNLQKLLSSFSFPPSFSAYSGYLPWVGGTVGCILLALLLFGSNDKEEHVSEDITHVEQAEKLIPVPEMNEVNENPEREEPPAAKMTGQMLEENTFEEETVVVQAEAVEQAPEEGVDQPPILLEPTVIGRTETETIISEKEDEGTENEEDKKSPEISASPEEMIGETKNVVLLRATRDLKKMPGISPEAKGLIIKAQPQSKVHKAMASSALSIADKLYNERLLAGAGWERNKKEDMYTVQLMALASTNAKENLKKMLVQENYRQEAGNFYIFEKSATTKNIFVFYGEYRNVETARLVQKSLPKFLRDHQPYALSIKGAIAKVRN
jgi:type II secretory pathway predicted ATPase ExeA/septal ring-binding cell division protein DamX